MATRKITAPAVVQSEVPALIAGSVNLLRFSEALARAGLIGRHDADRGVLVIEPALAVRVSPADALVGMSWFNGLSQSERAYWLEAAGSACPADAWHAFQSGVPGP